MQSDPPDPLVTALAGKYDIERELGRGGMATVYLATDVRHHRQVALKVLDPRVAAAIGSDRFLREIEIAARLNHPHILPLHDSGDAGGSLFYVMPFVRGESLRQKITREKRLATRDAVEIASQVASALGFAHEQGVIHRDIKPENILLHEGVAMVADFGIALAMRTATGGRLTEAGLLMGTPRYMSPEQALDQAADARTDLYSLGCVLYEMLTGEVPYAGPTTQAMMARRMTDPVPSVRTLRSDVPGVVDRTLVRTLAVAPTDRFASAAEFAKSLNASDPGPAGPPSVAVLPFLNLSADPDNEYFADGITEDVIAQLSRIRSLKVISRTSVMRFKKRDLSLRDIGAALEATSLLEGSVRRAADRVRIGAQLIDVEADSTLWAETYDRQLTDIFAIQSDVALQIATALRAELTRDEKIRMRKEPTRDVGAYKLYLEGRHYHISFTEDGLSKAIEHYERAIALDGAFAMAYVGVAKASIELVESGFRRPDSAYPGARQAIHRALELDPDLGEARCVLAHLKFTCDFDWQGAEQEFKRALELTPNSADAYDLYGRMCSAMGRFEEAITLQSRGNELDPLAHRADVATALLRAGRYDEALDMAQHAVVLDPLYARAHATLAWCFAKKGQRDESLVRMEKAVSLAPGDSIWLAQLGQLYGFAGQTEKALDILRQLQERSRERYVSPYHMAYVHTGLGDHDNAVRYLEQAFDDRSGAIYGIKGSFLFTTLHSNPGFISLLRRMNLA